MCEKNFFLKMMILLTEKKILFQKMKFIVFVFLLIIFNTQMYGFHPEETYRKLNTQRNLSTTVVIPCHYKHAYYLIEALEAYAKGTVSPDEVVISLSEVNLVPQEILLNLKERDWPFHLELITHEKAVSEGGNRNAGCSIAKGDIFILSDADDLPHPQRIEIIKYFFDAYDVDTLLSKLSEETDLNQCFDFNEIPHWQPSCINDNGPHANGAIAIRKEVFNLISWDESFRKAVDANFVNKSIAFFPKRIYLDIPIYLYRSNLTTYTY